MDKIKQSKDKLARVTKAVRKADRIFDKVGGSSRHWVRECFFPSLKEEGLEIVDAELVEKEDYDERLA